MKSTRANLVAASVIALGMMAGAASPALAKCTKKNPLFGFEYYVADKFCPKAKVMKKVVKKTTPKKTALKKQKPPVKAAAKLPAADPGVKEMQTLLTQAGYKPGPADGVKGAATTRALNNFRETLGLPSSTSHGNLMLALNRSAASNVAAMEKAKAESSKKAVKRISSR